MTISEIADELDTTYPTVYKWMDQHGIERRSSKESRDVRGSHAGCKSEGVHNSKSWLRQKYITEHQTVTEMAEAAGVSEATIIRRMDKYGIERRPNYVTRVLRNPGAGFVHADRRGYEMVKHSVEDHTYNYAIHRLLGIAKYGYEMVEKGVIHHKNGIPWDNRPDNIELKDSQSEHARHHSKERERDESGRYT